MSERNQSNAGNEGGGGRSDSVAMGPSWVPHKRSSRRRKKGARETLRGLDSTQCLQHMVPGGLCLRPAWLRGGAQPGKLKKEKEMGLLIRAPLSEALQAREKRLPCPGHDAGATASHSCLARPMAPYGHIRRWWRSSLGSCRRHHRCTSPPSGCLGSLLPAS